MSESTRCPKCGIQLPADAPAGLCPKCLVQAGFESEPLPQANPEPTLPSPSSSGFVAPSVEELASRFPQLEILELVGQGGMGAVYKARQPGLDRIVAVKILPPEVGRDPSFAERFTREARALARLSHPNIVTVHDFGQTSAPLTPSERGAGGEGSLYFFVMEFLATVTFLLVTYHSQRRGSGFALVAMFAGLVIVALSVSLIGSPLLSTADIAEFDKLLIRGHSAQFIREYSLEYTAPHIGPYVAIITGIVIVLLGAVELSSLARLRTARVAGVKSSRPQSSVESQVRPAAKPTPFADSGRVTPPSEARENTGTSPVPLPHLVQGPADCLLLAAGIAFVTACGVAMWLGVTASRGNQFTNSMVRGNLIGMSVGLAIYSVLVGVAGLMLRGLRARLFVLLVAVIVGLFFPVVVALNVLMELRNIPVWPVVIPLWIGMPAALWVVVTLFRDDVRCAFDAAVEQRRLRDFSNPSQQNPGIAQPSEADLNAAGKRVAAPAIGLIVAGGLACLPAIGVGFLHQLFKFSEPPSMADRIVPLALMLGLLAFPVASIVGAVKMLTLRSYRWAMAAGVLTLLPFPAGIGGKSADIYFHPVWLVTLPIGIWSLVVLSRSDVRAAFQAWSRSRAVQAPTSSRWLVTGIVLLVVALAGVAGLIVAPQIFQDAAKTISDINRPDSTRPKTGEVWFGNQGEEHVMFWGPNSPTVSDRLARLLGLDPSQRVAMNQAFQTSSANSKHSKTRTPDTRRTRMVTR